MKLERAIEIINNMYQSKMSEREEKTENGVIIHIGQDINFTKLEEASVRMLREVLRLKEELADRLPGSKIRERIEELNSNIKYLSKFKDCKEKNYTNEDIVNSCVEVLNELLEKEN